MPMVSMSASLQDFSILFSWLYFLVFHGCITQFLWHFFQCGRPVQEYVCPTCSCRIGGSSHKLLTTNRDARTYGIQQLHVDCYCYLYYRADLTEHGYCLGLPVNRPSTALPERSLTPVACTIIRVFLHCTLIWSSTNDDVQARFLLLCVTCSYCLLVLFQTLMEGLLELLKVKIRPVDVSMFVWNHLKKDVAILGNAMGKSQDEVCLILHMILRDISVKPPPSCK